MMGCIGKMWRFLQSDRKPCWLDVLKMFFEAVVIIVMLLMFIVALKANKTSQEANKITRKALQRDSEKEERIREELKEIISIDVQKTVLDLNAFRERYPRAKAMKKSKEPNWAPIINDYDTSVFDAYLHKIPLLSEETAKWVLLFYKNLRTINEAKYILQDNKGSDMSYADRNVWANVIYNGTDINIKIGNNIIGDCNGQDTMESNDSLWHVGQWNKVSAVSSTIDD